MNIPATPVSADTNTPKYYLNQTTSEVALQHILRFYMSKNPELDEKRLAHAVQFSIDAHRNQFRKSGMPYAEHPIEVSKMLADLKLDTNTVIAGLLHDVVEDTSYSLETIQAQFGAEVAFMVDAVTKISTLQEQSKLDQTAATYRKLITSMAKDPRVIMIKLADRVHNMRTLQYMAPEKRKRIAQETLDLYAPITYRFGLYRIKVELEDLSFKFLHPDKYRDIVLKLHSTKKQREGFIKRIAQPLQMRLNLEDFPAQVYGRPKHIYSIWKKMNSRQCQFEDLYDIFAIRIVVREIHECYHALGYVHNLFTPLQARFKDYISSPKPNMYQSLHTVVIGPDNRAIEVQIRTQEMDEIAERGIAAHWSYKQETMTPQQLEWLETLANEQQEISDSTEFMEFLRVDLKPQEMIVFTPKGKTVSLPVGATVLDFAFAVHTSLGYQCVGARINNEFFSPDRTLNYGQTIQILKSSDQQPSLEWLNFVTTHKARSAIRKWHRSLVQNQAIHLGKEIYQRELRLLRIPVDQHPPLAKVGEHFGLQKEDSFFESLGQGELPIPLLDEFLRNILPEKLRGSLTNRIFKFRTEAEEAVLVSRDDKILVNFAECCNPLPGDPICGALRKGKGIEIHVQDCPTFSHYSEETHIPVKWKDNKSHAYDVRLEILAERSIEIQEDILREFARQHVVISKASMVSNKKYVRDRFHIKVYNSSQIETIVQALRRIGGVKKVRRM
jgi:GTP diphosphokinase / guanosine-3',5'-bis(diphosphate) 3'-diphosphatase